MEGNSRDVLLLITFWLVTLCDAAPDYSDCLVGTYKSNSTYSVNLNILLHKIRSTNTQIHDGFYNSSAGRGPNTVYAIAMCRGDLAAPDCHKCFSDMTSELPEACPNFKGAIGWFDYCMLYYSNEPMFGEGVIDSGPGYRSCGPFVSHDGDHFYQALKALMSNLRRKAASGNSTLKFETGKSDVPASNVTIYGLMQCTPDINQTSCYDCLGKLTDIMARTCPSKISGILGAVNCNMRYDVSDFISNVAYPSPPRSSQNPASYPPESSGRGRKRSKHFQEIVAPPIVAAAASLLIFVICLITYKRRSMHTSDEDVSEIQIAKSLQFDLNQMKTATHNFSEDKKLGQGGFGTIYKGRLENGQEVAVKRLLKNKGQGIAEFKTEVVLVARLQHRNLVKLLGFCVSRKERILVYEYLPNGSLDTFLFDAAKRACLDWATRFKIICGIAKGLRYLHEDSRLKIIHRDLKSSNILLDDAMNPKIADFGLARLLGVDQTQGETNKIVGTYGYMAPEYAMTGRFSVKSDVYSFGIIVLEVVSGQRNRFINRSPTEEALLFRAWKFWNEGAVLELVDSCLGRSYFDEEVIKCIHVGLLCIQKVPSRRPNMASIVSSLSGHSTTLPSPTQPNFFSCLTGAAAGDNQVPESRMMTQGTTSTAPQSITEINPR